MALPDISRLVACDPATLRAFGRHLTRIGLTPAAARPLVLLASTVPPALRGPVRTFHLSMRSDPIACILRSFLFADPVPEEDARAAWGELYPTLLELGLLEPSGEGRVVSEFRLGIVNDLFVLSDDLSLGEGAAMGYGDSTIALCRASLPDARIERALDIGCGSGTAALLLARRATQSIGTDINPRAVELSRVNAAINGIENVEFRLGDLFAPVAGEAFDLIVSQPPFIPMPDGIAPSTFQFGGRRGDELVLSMLPQVPDHLAPGGRAVLLIEWPVDGTSLGERVARAVASTTTDVLVLHAPETDADDHATGYAALLHPDLGPGFVEDARRRRAHFHRTEVSGMKPTFTVLQRKPADATTKAWTHLVPIESFSRITVKSDRIDRLVAARRLLEEPARLLDVAARFPADTVFTEQQNGPGADAPSKIHARFSGAALTPSLELAPAQLLLLTAVHESPTVRAGIERFASDSGLDAEDAIARLLPQLRAAVASGILELPAKVGAA